MTGRRIIVWTAFGALALALLAAYGWASRHAALAPVARPAPSAFDRDLVARGRSLAGFGNCAVCHTREGGEPFAGGLALPTPFGTVHTTNITPDPETGIGAWSEAAFLRAMRDGVDRAGRHLYPVFPYDHFTRVAEADLKAIYAYLMAEVAPVAARPPRNDLGFPWNLRAGLAFWNLVYLDKDPWKPDPSRDAEWNRGAYLVHGLGHCGSCHTPRNVLGALEGGASAFSGAVVEGWHAPALDHRSPAPVPWTQAALVAYLMDGWHQDHGIAAGSMAAVANNLREQPEDDVFAIAAYVLSLQGGPRADPARAAERKAFAAKVEWGHPDNPPIPDDRALREGARVFQARCAECHRSGGRPVPLALTSTVNHPDAANVALIVLHGVKPPQGALGRSMPALAAQIPDAEMVALLRFVRARFSREPPWSGLEETVGRARAAGPKP
jgi:mono/diheme cytochrome c family protein